MRSWCLGTLLGSAIGIGVTPLAFVMVACSSPRQAAEEQTKTKAVTPQPAPRRRAAARVHPPIPFKWRSGFQLPNGEPKVPRTFALAKQLAESEVYKAHRVTFYRRCDYSADGKLDTSRCGFTSRKKHALAQRMKWARIVPLSAFGPRRFCWNASVCKTKGLACCRKIDPDFRRMESDLHNLVPVAAEPKSDRRGFHLGNITGEPPASVRGDIARAYLYMHFTYKKKDPKDWLEEGGLPLTPAQIQRFLRWHQQDPPDAWELQRDQRIADLQGGHNGMLVPWRKLHCGECTDEKLALLISNLKAPETVTELEIDPGRLTAAGLVHVAKLKNLRELGLTDWNVYVDASGWAPLAKLTQLRSLYLSETHIGSAGLVHLAKLSNLRTLDLARTRVGSAGLAHLAKLANLRYLNLSRTRIGHVGMAHLSRLSVLKKLDLSYTKIGNAGLVHLAKLRSLEELFLDDTRINGAGLAHLTQLNSLRFLKLEGTAVGSDGFVHLAKLINLRTLHMSHTRVRDAGFEHLVALKKLKMLWLANTHVGDAALEHLAKIPSLTDVFMPFTEASQASVQRFRKRRPDCNIGYCHRRTCPRSPMRRGRIRLPR